VARYMCKTKFKEQGMWFEVETVVDLYKKKTKQGLDISFECDLLKSWKRRDAEYRKYITEYGF